MEAGFPCWSFLLYGKPEQEEMAESIGFAFHKDVKGL